MYSVLKDNQYPCKLRLLVLTTRTCEDMIDHRNYAHNLSSCEIKAQKIFRPERDITHDLCDLSGAVFYQLSYQAIWELGILWVRNIPVDGEECKWIYERSYIWTAEKDTNLWLIIAFIHKPEEHSGLNGIRTHDLCDTGVVLYQLSYQSNWELVTSWVRNIPVDGEELKWIYERSLIWTSEKDLKALLIIAVMPLCHARYEKNTERIN